MDDTVREKAYGDALKFVSELVKRPNFRPEQMADAIDKKFSISFENNGVTTAENIKSQYSRDVATAMTKVIDNNGNMPDKGSSAYKNIIEPVAEGRAIKGAGLPTWKRMEDMVERYPTALKDAKEQHAAIKAMHEAKDLAREAIEVAKAGKGLTTAFAKVASHVPVISKLAAGATLGAGLVTGANASTPEARNDALKGVAVSAAKLFDPTEVILPTMVHYAVGKQGPSPLQTTLQDMSSGELPKNRNPRIVANLSKQDFIMSGEHPGQLSVLQDASGKTLDTRAMLKDPQQRQKVFDEIDRRAETASPQGKELFKEMKTAAQDFVTLENDIRKLIPAAPQPAQPQVAVAATKPQAFAPA